MYDPLREDRKLVMALLTATAYEDDMTDPLSGKDSPLAAVDAITEETWAAEVTGVAGPDLRLTVRLPFGTVLAAPVLDRPRRRCPASGNAHALWMRAVTLRPGSMAAPPVPVKVIFTGTHSLTLCGFCVFWSGLG